MEALAHPDCFKCPTGGHEATKDPGKVTVVIAATVLIASLFLPWYTGWATGWAGKVVWARAVCDQCRGMAL